MRILFISTNSNPLDVPINGDAQRTRLLFEACKRIAEVDVISFEDKPSKVQPLGRLKKWTALLPFSSLTALFPVDSQWETAIDAAVAKGDYDCIVARYFYRAIPCGLWKYREKLVVDFDDALPFFFLNQMTPTSAWTSRIRLRWSARRAKTITRRAVRMMKTAFFAEKSVAESNQAVYLPNIPYYSGNCADADMGTDVKRMVFVGQLEYKPNREGIDRFLEQVYRPLVRRLPKVELHLVGLINDEVTRQRWQSYPGVTVTGFVEDLKQEYEQSHVVVVPVYQCGATNIKLLEAMAMNRACVTTMQAYDRVQDQFENKKDLFAAVSDKEFIEALETLLKDEQVNHRMARNGRSVMDQYFSRDAFCEIVKTAIIR